MIFQKFDSPIGSLFPRSADHPERFHLTGEQVSFFQENGFLAGVRVLTDEQIEVLRASLERLADPQHPGHSLFYEFHSNESSDPATVLFHALGAWRIEEPFHDILWNAAFVVPASQLLGGPVRFGMISCSASRRTTAALWRGIRITLTGPGRSRSRI